MNIRVTTPCLSVYRLQEAVDKLGGLDHLYLNHAIMPRNDHRMWPDAGDSLLDDFEQTMNINTNSYVFLYTAAFPHLLKSSDARVAVVSSIAGWYWFSDFFDTPCNMRKSRD